MPKKFFTELDIEEMFAQGLRSFTVTEEMVITEMAYEKARSIGLRLVWADEKPPSAPVRPYLSETRANTPHMAAVKKITSNEDVRHRIHNAVKLKMGEQIQPDLLDQILDRILPKIGLE
jgi:hypothetical protein